VWPSDALGVAPRQVAERAAFGVGCADSKTVSNVDLLLALQQRGVALNHHLVNMGAGDDCVRATVPAECDEANVLLPLGTTPAAANSAKLAQSDERQRAARGTLPPYAGVLFEPTQPAPGLHVYDKESVRVDSTRVSAANVVALLDAARVPADVDLLKFDIDDTDCDVLHALLTTANERHQLYRPKVVQAEFNVMFPPPLRYTAVDDTRWKWGAATKHATQASNECSLAALVDIFAAADYVLVQVDYWDVWFMHAPVFAALSPQLHTYDDATWYVHGFAGQPSVANCLRATAFRGPVEDAASPFAQYLKLVKQRSRSGVGDARWFLNATDARAMVRATWEWSNDVIQRHRDRPHVHSVSTYGARALCDR